MYNFTELAYSLAASLNYTKAVFFMRRNYSNYGSIEEHNPAACDNVTIVLIGGFIGLNQRVGDLENIC